MSIRITLYGPMRVVVGRAEVELSCEGPSITLAGVIDLLIARYPRVRPYLLGEAGELQRVLRILRNGQRPDPDLTLTTLLQTNDSLAFLMPVGGGA